ncbi:pectinesterase inhibitor 6 isoform X1 [Vigna radiata var. radiata]|uniref:Pectinesterase inhibitor 6 isoform X1 n=1 Tax=Vigna radiata var. radiata TaxID=3916 RepID=A0A3Q0ESL6_VIGRR|nr:pectinesterase inhibitor 6 isoform X1 [Vigna radiata var. radiata]
MITLPRPMFLFLLFLSLLTSPGQMVSAKGKENVTEACSVTRYQSLCIQSLSQFSNTAGRSPSKWARAGVSVSIGEVKNVKAYLAELKKHGHMKGRNKVALSDCVECFSYALDELHRSLGVLRRLSKSTFSTQMGDLNTWISAALTDEETCLEGFEGENEKHVKVLQNRVQNVSYITSNALALVNKLATTDVFFTDSECCLFYAVDSVGRNSVKR